LTFFFRVYFTGDGNDTPYLDWIDITYGMVGEIPSISGVTISPSEAKLYDDITVDANFATTPDKATCYALNRSGVTVGKPKDVTSGSCVFVSSEITPDTGNNMAIYAQAGGLSAEHTSATFTVEDTNITDPSVTLYNIIKDNLAGDFTVCKVSTAWYNERFTEPQIVVGHIGTPDKVKTIHDTLREHKSIYYIDTWVTGTIGSDTSVKKSRYRLDNEIKRIIRANKDDPSEKIRRLRIEFSEPLDEITKEKKIFRTRHRVLVHWFENI
jgi:hypothetical protein